MNFESEFYNPFVNLIKAQAGRFVNRNRGFEYEDLFQEGCIQLYTLATKFSHLPVEEFGKLFKTHIILHFKTLYNMQVTQKRDHIKAGLYIDLSELNEEHHLSEKIQAIFIEEFVQELKAIVSESAGLYIADYLQETAIYEAVIQEAETRRRELQKRGKKVIQKMPTFDVMFGYIRKVPPYVISKAKAEIRDQIMNNSALQDILELLSFENQKFVVVPFSAAFARG